MTHFHFKKYICFFIKQFIIQQNISTNCLLAVPIKKEYLTFALIAYPLKGGYGSHTLSAVVQGGNCCTQQLMFWTLLAKLCNTNLCQPIWTVISFRYRFWDLISLNATPFKSNIKWNNSGNAILVIVSRTGGCVCSSCSCWLQYLETIYASK